MYLLVIVLSSFLSCPFPWQFQCIKLSKRCKPPKSSFFAFCAFFLFFGGRRGVLVNANCWKISMYFRTCEIFIKWKVRGVYFVKQLFHAPQTISSATNLPLKHKKNGVYNPINIIPTANINPQKANMVFFTHILYLNSNPFAAKCIILPMLTTIMIIPIISLNIVFLQTLL